MVEAAHAIGIVQQFAIDAEAKGVVTAAEAKTLVTATLRISEAGKVAATAIKAIHNNDPSSRTKALDAIGIVADQLRQLQSTLNIKSETARHEVEAGLLLVQTALNSARIIIAAQE
jgi:uncharacterized protein YoaH (UPF0181 family)